MKKILMAAVAVSALTAGSASALVIDETGTTVSSSAVSILPTGGQAAIAEAFTIASETQITSATNIPFVLKVTPTSAALPVSQNYIITYTITGGTFETTGIAPGDIAITGAATGNAGLTTGDVTPTRVQFVFSAGASASLASVTWTSKGIIPSSDKTPVVVTASLANNLSPSQPIDGGSTSQTVIDYRQALTFVVDTPSVATLSIASGFKKFGTAATLAGGTADATSAKIAAGVRFAKVPASSTALASDVVYRLSGASVVSAADVTAATLTIAGSLAGLDARVGSGATLQLADASTGVISLLNATNLASLVSVSGASITVQQKATPVVPTEGSYTIRPTDVVLTAGMLPFTYAAKAAGSVAYEGVNFYGSWLADGAGTSGFKNTIRLGNKSTTAIASVKASLINPLVTGTSGTVASTTTCEVGPLPASGELLVTSAKLYACFGAFGRSDVRLTIQGNKSDLSAKMRLTSPDGSAADTVLGSGTADATDTYQ